MYNTLLERLPDVIYDDECLYEELIILAHRFNWLDSINIDTLFGAIIGGTLALMGSIVVNRIQYKHQAELKRAETIYIPLYNELVKNHNDILIKNPYPSYISFTKEKRMMPRSPQYSVWEEVKLDSRYLESPKAIVKIMNDLTASILAYQSNHESLCQKIQLFINNVLEEETGKSYSLHILVLSILNDIANKDFDGVKKLIEPFNSSRESTEEIWEQAIKRIIEETPSCSGFVELEMLRNTWRILEQQAIDYLAHLIKKATK